MGIGGFLPAIPRLTEDTSTKEEYLPLLCNRSTAGEGLCKERAKETRGNTTGLTAWSNLWTDRKTELCILTLIMRVEKQASRAGSSWPRPLGDQKQKGAMRG
jgi:hypothetical protein